jgi:glycosyltransferase involved in cell wall biosynthesis
MLSAMDLFLASSAQETFGLSVLEALANGLPALYTTCPALEGVDTDRACQVPGTAADLRRAIEQRLTAEPLPRTPDQAVYQRYGIEPVAAAVDSLYEALGGAAPPYARAVRRAATERPGGVRRKG